MQTRLKQPFSYLDRKDFKEKLVMWIGDVLYDILPEFGFEERDEQIYTAFQIADAFCDKKIHLAEAGLGTGKTFAYLLSAIPYARLTRKPVVIACATSALQEQLASKTGDVETLSKLLGLQADARMAKDSKQYICDVRVTENREDLGKTSDEISQWLLQTKWGERSEIPHISDQIWNKISWNEFVNCDVCDSRGYCSLVAARKYYRGAEDLLIVDHETFFHDLWTRELRIADGKLPILPNYSAVIFDEGHKVLLPAMMQAGHQIKKEEINGILNTLEEIQDARDSLVRSTLAVGKACQNFFDMLCNCIIPSENTERMSIQVNPSLIKEAEVFRKSLDALLLEMEIEQELYMETLTPTQIQAFQGLIERAMIALHRFVWMERKAVIPWVDRKDGSFWVVPRNIGEMLNKHLYQKEIPIIFTSATLSNQGNFDYFARVIGLEQPSKSTVGSSFDLKEQVSVVLESVSENNFQGKIQKLVQLLVENKGRALVLTNSMEEVGRIRESVRRTEVHFSILWEDEGDRGYLVQKFREEETTVLVGSDFWEGVDVPGDALTLIVIWQLPFPETDPLIEVQRKEAREKGLEPVAHVDYPEMGLKLKQGCGRLIRSRTDKGRIVILDRVIGMPWEEIVLGALPENAEVLKK